MTDIHCFRMENMRAEIAETKRYCLLGNRVAARYHAGQVLIWANKLKHAGARKAAMTALNKLRGRR